MGADGDEIGVERMNRVDRQLAHPLSRVTVEDDLARAAERTDVSHRLQRADLVVGSHDRDQDSVVTQNLSDAGNFEPTVRWNRYKRQFKTFVLREVFQHGQDGRMFNRGRHEVSAAVAQFPRHAEEGQVDRLGCSTRENDLRGLATPPSRHALAVLI